MMTNRLPSTNRFNRAVRVFISSTFRDMQGEREELIKRTFPQLRKLCEQRGVTWGEVDLRWGISDEQKAEGKVLPICLAEINNSRPYFIGLLGERYGWVPTEIAQQLIEREPWLAEHTECSVTELEILHGVLRNPQMADHAFFYFRNPSFVDDLPPDQQAFFKELPTAEELAQFGPDEAMLRAERRRRKLESLKNEIRASGFPLYENYRNPRELGERVLQDFTAMIDRLFPADSEPNQLDREAAEHEAFAQDRARVYIGGAEYFQYLDAHAESDEPPLAVLGPSGAGKSALLANWALSYRGRHPDHFLFMYFVGATAVSTDWAAMLRRLMGELKRHFGIEQEIPERADALRAEFAHWLQMVSVRGPAVLVLDGLNQLEDKEGAVDLVWLPLVLPPNLRIFISTLAGRALEEAEKRGWPTLYVEPLSPEERRQLIKEYLEQYTKSLSPAQTGQIAQAAQTANPLYLRTLLEELRLHGDHFTLDQKINHYLQATTVDSLYQRILERCEEDYERDRWLLVRDAMSLTWATRRGLSEVELLELLGAGQEPLPSAYWSPFYLALEHSFISRSGLIGFSHDYLRQAVTDRYLFTEQKRRRAHLRLAAYFGARPLNGRTLDELPWQLAAAKDWDGLREILVGESFLVRLWDFNEYEVMNYWVQIEANSSLHITEAYRHVLEEEDLQNVEYVNSVGQLLMRFDHYEEALLLFDRVIWHYRKTGERAKTAKLLMHQAHCWRQSDDEKAMQLYLESEGVCREFDDRAQLQAVLANRATLFERRGDVDRAVAMYAEQEAICREIGLKGQGKYGLVFSLCKRGAILQERGETEKALSMFLEGERVARENGDLTVLAIALSCQAEIFASRGDIGRARLCYREADEINGQFGYMFNLNIRLAEHAIKLWQQSEFERARSLFGQQETLCLQLGNTRSLRNAYGLHAQLEESQENLQEALALYTKEESLCRELGLQKELRLGLSRKSYVEARVLGRAGNLWEAAACLQRQEEAYREAGNKNDLQGWLGQQALVLNELRQFDQACLALKEKAEICHELGNKEQQGAALINLGLNYSLMEAWGESIRYYREAEEVYRELKDQKALNVIYNNLAALLMIQGDLDAALNYAKEGEGLSRQSGDEGALCDALRVRVRIQESLSQIADIEPLIEEAEMLCRKLDRAEDLARILSVKGALLKGRGENAAAILLYRELQDMYRAQGKKPELLLAMFKEIEALEEESDTGEALVALFPDTDDLIAELNRRQSLQRDLEALFCKAEELCVQLNNREACAYVIQRHAILLDRMFESARALELYRKEEQILRELNDTEQLFRCLDDQALILIDEDEPGAIEKYAEVERWAREIGDQERLGNSLYNQAYVYFDMLGDAEAALPKCQEAIQVFTDAGLSTKCLSDALSMLSDIEQVEEYEEDDEDDGEEA